MSVSLLRRLSKVLHSLLYPHLILFLLIFSGAWNNWMLQRQRGDAGFVRVFFQHHQYVSLRVRARMHQGVFHLPRITDFVYFKFSFRWEARFTVSRNPRVSVATPTTAPSVRSTLRSATRRALGIRVMCAAQWAVIASTTSVSICYRSFSTAWDLMALGVSDGFDPAIDGGGALTPPPSPGTSTSPSPPSTRTPSVPIPVENSPAASSQDSESDAVWTNESGFKGVGLGTLLFL